MPLLRPPSKVDRGNVFIPIYLSACLFVSRISQNVMDRFGQNLVDRLGNVMRMNLFDFGENPDPDMGV